MTDLTSHTPIARRTVLRGAGVLSLAAAVSGTFGGMTFAQAAPADLASLRDAWVDQLTGRKVIDAADQDFSAAIGRLDTAVDDSLSKLDSTPGRTKVFTDLSLSDDAKMVSTYTRLTQIATAWATPGSKHVASDAALQAVLAGLADTHRLVYNANQAEYGNWWSWEIGSSKALADAMALVADHLSQDQIDAYCGAIDHFVPDPWRQFPPSRSVVSEGANRVDLCQAAIVSAIVAGDTGKLDHAVAGLTVVWQYVTSGTGFFTDGSFIQHSTMAYTGTYGLVLLGGLSKLFALLADSGQTISDPSKQILFDAVEKSFAPFVYDGQMSDAVRGRAISRTGERSFDDGNGCIESVLRLASAVDAATARRWQAICRGWIDRNHTKPMIPTASIPRLALVKALLNRNVAGTPEPTGPRLFPAMARAVHRGRGWSVSLGMSSRRISWYECGNGENNLGYQTGSGVTYLSIDTDQDHFDGDFWPTVDQTRLAGTTVDTTPLAPKVEGEWATRCPQNDWTGGAALGDVAVVGQHLIAPGRTGLTARKMWFFDDKQVVALGAGIRTGTSAPVETIVENRNLGSSDRRLLVDGRKVGTGAFDKPRWAHLDGIAGYLFLDADQVTATTQTRTGSWSKINTGGPTTEVSNTFTLLSVQHGAKPADAHYGYVILPKATAKDTAHAAAGRGGVQVLSNTADLQMVRSGATTAICCWARSTADGIGLDGPAAVVLRSGHGTVQVSLADPTAERDQVVLTLAGHYRRRSGGGVTVSNHRGLSTVTVDTGGRGGVAVQFTLAR